ncbi:MAG: PKD domain-containing protein [Solirubrobacterales bacterium]
MSSRRFGAKRGCLAVALTLALLSVPGVPVAGARNAYVTNSGDGTVSVFDAATNAPLTTIPVGGEPVSLAITPDGTRAYVADAAKGTVTVISTATNAVLGAPIPVGLKPDGVAITPDGGRVYVANAGNDTVTVISTATNGIIGAPVSVGKEPDGIAISPDGHLALIAQRGGNVSIIDTSSNAVVGSVLDALGPAQIAIGPRGGRAFVTNRDSNSVTAFNPVNGSVIGGPITVGKEPDGIAIGPNGLYAYAASPADGTLTPIDTSLNAPLSAPIAFPGATGVAIQPSGLQGYVTNRTGGSVSVLDTTRNAAAGTITAGAAPTDVAVVPDQGPHASFWVSPAKRRAKTKLTFHASGSFDPDGTIASYAWTFGDGGHVQSSATTLTHRYRKPGTYQVSLVTTDNEGCSTQVIYTGQTASCNGSAAAAVTLPITVIDATGPMLQLAGGKRQRLQGRMKLLARCPREPCSVVARGLVVASIEARGSLRKHRYRLGSASASLRAGTWGRLGLPVPKRARLALLRILKRGGQATATLTAVASDTTGNQTLRERTVRLILPRPRHR